MASANATPASLPLRWLPTAEAAYLKSLQYIAAQDQHAADLVAQRVARALTILSAQPSIGTTTSVPGRRRFPIPKIGHLIEYHVTKNVIRVTRWARHSRKP